MSTLTDEERDRLNDAIDSNAPYTAACAVVESIIDARITAEREYADGLLRGLGIEYDPKVGT